LLGSFLLLFLPLAVMEGVFRLLPVNSGLGTQPVNAEQPVLHFAPGRDFTYSKGWDFALINRGRINQAGFVNDQDYQPQAKTPLLAVMGDSYVESLMVPYGKTLQGRLAAQVEGTGRVYSFAASGAPLSQYVAWADHARQTYQPQAMAFVIIGNDFDESLLAYKQAPGFHYYAQADDGSLHLQRVDYQPGIVRTLAASSALIRYVLFNLNGAEALQALAAPRPSAPNASLPAYVGNTDASLAEPRLSRSKAAVDAFFRDLPAASGLASQNILFLLDGLRQAAHVTEQAEQSYFQHMRAYFAQQARQRGYEVQDLQPRFLAQEQADGRRFDFGTTDAHWNENGHQVAAQAVLDSRLFRHLFPTKGPTP
jgi:hypothetical protein